ncbi:MAG: hypothetical protein ABR583_06355 [Gaiellaceae bacterium]
MRGRLSLLVLATLTLLLAACGGGDGGGDEDERLSAPVLRTQVTRVCDRFFSRLDSLPSPKTPRGVAPYSRRARVIYSDTLEGLRALRPPESVENDYHDWLGAWAARRDAFDAIESAAVDDDVPGLQVAIGAAKPHDLQVRRLALKLGFKRCTVRF